jgi:hypothetical protein
MMMLGIVVNGKHIDYDDFIRYNRYGSMVTDETWKSRVKLLLKGELSRRGIGYKELAVKLEALGVPETEQNIANKLSRGGFSAVFLIQCLDAIDCKTLRLGMD